MDAWLLATLHQSPQRQTGLPPSGGGEVLCRGTRGAGAPVPGRPIQRSRPDPECARGCAGDLGWPTLPTPGAGERGRAHLGGRTSYRTGRLGSSLSCPWLLAPCAVCDLRGTCPEEQQREALASLRKLLPSCTPHRRLSRLPSSPCPRSQTCPALESGARIQPPARASDTPRCQCTQDSRWWVGSEPCPNSQAQ